MLHRKSTTGPKARYILDKALLSNSRVRAD
jgi:hypothetical protein